MRDENSDIDPDAPEPTPWVIGFVRQEWLLLVSFATSIAFLIYGTALQAGLADPARLALVFVWLFAVILGSAIAAVRHADHIAVALGEPYGTLILTLSVTFIEVASISAVMMHGGENPTLVRDTLDSVVMIILNGMVGLALLLGAWRHREQSYNLQGANTYLGAIVPLVVLSLVLPTFTTSTGGPTLSGAQQAFLVIVSVGLYGAFLAVQTGRHRGYFTLESEGSREPRRGPTPGLLPSTVLLVLYLVPVAFLAEQMASPVDYLIETLRAPAALGGIIIAVLVATPEAIGAVRASTANRVQRSINIFLGSVLSTTGLTIPAMILVSHLTGHEIVLGVEGPDLVMLLLTLTVSVITFASGRTNVIQGGVHLILFAAYVLLIFQS